MADWTPSQGERCPVTGIVYSPRYPRFCDPWTIQQCTPLWARIKQCRPAAVLELMRESDPVKKTGAIFRRAIQIAGRHQCRRPYQSWSEKLAQQRGFVKWVRRRCNRA